MKSSNILLSLGEQLIVSRDNNENVCVHYDCGFVKDGSFIIGVCGRGDDFESACDDYLAQIRGKTLVIDFPKCFPTRERKEIRVLG